MDLNSSQRILFISTSEFDLRLMTPILLFDALYGMDDLWQLRACLFEFASGGYVMVNSPSRQSNPLGSTRPKAVIDQTTKKPAEAGLIAGI